MVDVIALGEMLIDFVPDRSGVALAEAERFVRAAGGAPANVAVGVARLGRTAGFVGKVGDDPFGVFLRDTLVREGVDASQVRFDGRARTALAFVSLTAEGERDFVFFRHPSADMRHHPDDLDAAWIAGGRILHHGSISLIVEPARSATLRAVEVAREAGLLVSYDPNLRLPLWPDAEAAREGIRSAWRTAHVIKISDDELEFLTGSREPAAAEALLHDELRLLLVTRGEGGVDWYAGGRSGRVPGFEVPVADTTGAGDAFVAGTLAALAADPGLPEAPERLEAALRRANATAAITTTGRGAIPSLPRTEDVDAFLAERG